ncbi:ABC transporter ATP-binding protein [Crocosphaera sp. XPORK-15E]|uniref:ABC transporter ATP-binding protein n=1 Tax=Crocosphaera sp. XPORK-15E TaxID=3110247 RepID=UPI002B203969|nr:ABC transporter ATP-binding protein [Crocosphaera sp. XPORK-15E]MEA5536708.1 ABC transporter ATP-binding protein [Crocosphaera sp. XPORK-15E]
MPIETQNLSGGYFNKLVIQDINLTLKTGEWLSLVGANGSGKSTFLKLINRILTPEHGQVLLDGKSIHNLPPHTIAQKMAILPQQQTIPIGLTVFQLVSLGRTPHQNWWQWELNLEDRNKVENAIIKTQLEPFRDRLVTELSGGERQRAFLALALAQNPRILLLDEPTTYLDIHYQLQLLELLKTLQIEQQLTIITVLHDINLAARYSDRLALLKQGKLYTVGQPIDVLKPPILRDVFDIEVMVINTPVGLQICPLSSVN